MKRRSILDFLGKRSRASLIGNGIITLVGGGILIIVLFFKKITSTTINKESPNYWLEYKVLNPSCRYDSLSKVSHFVNLGVPLEEVEKFTNYIKENVKGGKIIKKITPDDLDSISKERNLELELKYTDKDWIFYVNSLQYEDFIIVTKDSTIQNIVYNVSNRVE